MSAAFGVTVPRRDLFRCLTCGARWWRITGEVYTQWQKAASGRGCEDCERGDGAAMAAVVQS